MKTLSKVPRVHYPVVHWHFWSMSAPLWTHKLAISRLLISRQIPHPISKKKLWKGAQKIAGAEHTSIFNLLISNLYDQIGVNQVPLSSNCLVKYCSAVSLLWMQGNILVLINRAYWQRLWLANFLALMSWLGLRTSTIHLDLGFCFRVWLYASSSLTSH